MKYCATDPFSFSAFPCVGSLRLPTWPAKKLRRWQTFGKLIICGTMIFLVSAASAQPVPPDSGDTNAPPTAAEMEAMRLARLAQYETNRLSVLPYLHVQRALPDGSPWLTDSANSYQQSQLLLLADENQTAFNAAQIQVSNWSISTGEPAVSAVGEDRTVTLIGFRYDRPILIMSDDIFQADTIGTDKLWPSGGSGLALTGANTIVGMWDEAAVRGTHLEFASASRVTQRDNVTIQSRHSTGVAGVLAAAGAATLNINGTNVAQAARGMSYQAQVYAHDANQDTVEMPSEASANNFQLSNHSYGPASGWFYYSASNVWRWAGETSLSQNEDFQFGFYHSETAARDLIAYSAPYYLPIWTAGNNRGEQPPAQPTNHQIFVSGSWISSPLISRNADGDTGGYDTIHFLGTAKNVLTVGACWPISGGYSGSNSVVLPSFSPFGPTDDGRIKPDVVAPGVNSVMPSSTGDSQYYADSGTSFAAPSVTGSLNLIAQLHGQLHTNARPYLSSTIKALAIHTADECGTSSGPDFQYGWGLFDAQSAADVIQANATNGWKSHIKEIVLPNGGTCEFQVVATNTKPLKVTIVWTDPPGVASQFASIDPTNAMLVNDLDLRVISPGGITNAPWILNPDLVAKSAIARGTAATTGDDDRNNVEQVFIAIPTSGNYTVRVTHKGTLHGSTPQAFSLVASGNIAQSKPALIVTNTVMTATNKIALTWQSVVGQNYIVQARDDVASGSWTNATGEINAIKSTLAVELPFSSGNAQQFYRIEEIE